MEIVKDRCFRFQTWLCENVSNEVLAWLKIQAKVPSHSGAWAQGEWQKNTYSSERLKNIGHSMSINSLSLGVNSVTVSYLIQYDSLLQNSTDIVTKCISYFITKCYRRFFITKCNNYYKLRQLYYKMRQFLQNATFITNFDSTITHWAEVTQNKINIFNKILT